MYQPIYRAVRMMGIIHNEVGKRDQYFFSFNSGVMMKIELRQLNKSTKYTVCATNSYPSRYLCANVSHKEAKQIVEQWAATYLYLDESEQIVGWIEKQAA